MIKEKILLIFDKLNLLITKVAAYFNYPFICYLSILISLKRHNFFTKRKKKNILVLYRSLGIFDLEKFNDINQSHSLFILHDLLFISYYALFVIRYSLFIIYFPLLII